MMYGRKNMSMSCIPVCSYALDLLYLTTKLKSGHSKVDPSQ